MDPEFVMGRSQRDLVERARAALRQAGAGADVRIVEDMHEPSLLRRRDCLLVDWLIG